MQSVRIFARLRRRKILYFSAFAVIILLVGTLLIVNIFKTSKKTKAAITCDASSPRNCTLDADTTLAAGDTSFDKTNLVVDGKTLYISGQHTFENLLVKNSGALRAQPLVAGTDFNQTTGEITTSGANKFIDLVIRGKLEVSNFGIISAAGAGYPAGLSYSADPAWQTWRGYGPDAAQAHPGGKNQLGVATSVRAAGGASAGAGGDGNDSGTVVAGSAGVGYNNSPSTTAALLPGAGGGIAYRSADLHESTGGSGGGVIKIKATEFEISGGGVISAAGAGPSNCLSTSSCAGAGGGGAIYLEYQESSAQIRADISGGSGLATTPGQSGTLLTDGAVLSGSVINLSAKGGDGGDGTNNISGGGGGGRIVIIKKEKPLASIKKSVIKIYDVDYPDGGAPNDSPVYGLKPNDKIEVTLLVNNLTPGKSITIKDEVFKNGSNGFLGDPVPVATPTGITVVANPDAVTWTFVPIVGQTTVTLKYQLTVK